MSLCQDCGSALHHKIASNHHDDPIAIVGLACRLPGGVDGPAALWDLLSQGKSGKGPVPASRFNTASFQDKGLPHEGYFLQEDVRHFDNDFFGILSAEATCMDPQQRKLLEIVYECFENAGVKLEQVSGSNTGCYVGNFSYDFISIQTKDPDQFSRYSATGIGSTILSNRISHVFNLTGPSQVIDTACSASMYALHAAVMGLQNADCDAAVVAGANLIQSVEQYLAMIKGGFISPTGACHTFSDEADGYARGEGLCSLYLKRLSDAVRNNDPIRAIIRATAVGSNGKTGGISAPDADAQLRVIDAAYRRVDFSPDTTSFVECHGTGTAAGDPCEVEALGRYFGRSKDHPLLLSGIKPNIGHGEAVSGLSSIMKAILALEHRELPQTAGVKSVNKQINQAESGIQLVLRNQKLRPVMLDDGTGTVLRAGINSFGYGGANSHVILEKGASDPSLLIPRAQTRSRSRSISPLPKVRRRTLILPISAGSQQSLQRRIEQLGSLSPALIDLTNLAYTLGSRRTHFRQRAFLTIQSDTAKINTAEVEALLPSHRSQSIPKQLAFVFTGQGAQWPGMASELIEEHAAFRRSIRTMDRVLQSLPDRPQWSVEDHIKDGAGGDILELPNPGLTITVAVQVGLVELLNSWGVAPRIVIGHSSGEIAAAFASGLITSGEAIIIAYYLGLSYGPNRGQTAMAAASCSTIEAEAEIERLGLQDSLCIACVNSQSNVTISGQRAALQQFMDSISTKSIKTKLLRTGGAAYHWTKLDPRLERRIDSAFDSVPFSTSLKNGAGMISTLTGEPLKKRPDVAYWRRNMESQVRFAHAVEEVFDSNDAMQFIEIGPHNTLELPLNEIWAQKRTGSGEVPYMSTLIRDQSSVECLLGLVGTLFCMGHDIVFGRVNTTTDVGNFVVTDLPPYPWSNEKILWKATNTNHQSIRTLESSHELLGVASEADDRLGRRWENTIDLSQVPWISSHRVEEAVVFPAAGYISMAIEALRQIIKTVDLSTRCEIVIEHFVIQEALVFENDKVATVMSLHPVSSAVAHQDIKWTFQVTSHKDGFTNLHASGTVSLATPSKQATIDKPLLGSRSVDADVAYRDLARAGLNFGPHFRSLRTIVVASDDDSRYAETELTGSGEALRSGELPSPSYLIHPIVIDSLLQSGIFAHAALAPSAVRAYLPVSADMIRLSSLVKPQSQGGTIIARTQALNSRTLSLRAELSDEKGSPMISLDNLKMSFYAPATQQVLRSQREAVLKSTWTPVLKMSSWSIDHIVSVIGRVFAEAAQRTGSPQDLLHIITSLMARHQPATRLLEITSDVNMQTGNPLPQAHIASAMGSFAAYRLASLQADGSLEYLEQKQGKYSASEIAWSGKSSSDDSHQFDLLFLLRPRSHFPTYGTSKLDVKKAVENAQKRLAVGGVLFTDFAETRTLITPQNLRSIPGTELAAWTKVGNTQATTSSKRNLIIVQRDASPVSNKLAHAITDTVKWDSVQSLKFQDLQTKVIPASSAIISLLEIEHPLLSSVDEESMTVLRRILSRASQVVWVTSGSLLREPIAEFALASALGRSLMLEQPALQFFTFDLDRDEIDLPETTANILSIADQDPQDPIDFEFAQIDGLAYISRISPERGSSSILRQRQGDEYAERPLGEVVDYQPTIDGSGSNKSITLEAIPPSRDASLPDNMVELSTEFQSLSAGDLDVDVGSVNCKSGRVIRIGAAIRDLSVGDEVIAMTSGKFKFREFVPRYNCCKIPDKVKASDVCASFSSVVTAIYGLHYRARVEADATALVVGGGTGLGRVTAQIAAVAGMRVTVSAETETEIESLKKISSLGHNTFYTLADDLTSVAGQKLNPDGFDFIINCMPLDMETRRLAGLMSPSATWIEFNDADIGHASELALQANMTLITVNIPYLLKKQGMVMQKKWTELLSLALDMYQQDVLELPTHHTYDTDQLQQACNHASRQRKDLICLRTKLSSQVKVLSKRFQTTFDPDKSYVIFGGLGGIGRNLAKWMRSQGARRLILVGRSAKPKTKEARADIETLSGHGASVQIVSADLTSAQAVKEVLQNVTGQIGGVVHAAMALDESVFDQMKADSWHKVIDPKLIGCWNIHKSLEDLGADVDFFLMLSSISGTIGQIAQSNYCAANSALDWFARYRGSQGLPAVAVALGMVAGIGYLSDNPEVQARLARSGITSLNEEEVLHVIDIALSAQSQPGYSDDLTLWDPLSRHTVLTGIEKPVESDSSTAITGPLATDPRLALLCPQQPAQSRKKSVTLQPLRVDVPGSGLITPAGTETTILAQFAEILEMDVDIIDTSKAMVDLGIDSLLGTELRTWCFKKFRVDVSLFKILSRGTTVRAFINTIADGLQPSSPAVA